MKSFNNPGSSVKDHSTINQINSVGHKRIAWFFHDFRYIALGVVALLVMVGSSMTVLSHTASAAILLKEAETLTFNTSGAGIILNDTTASGGQSMQIWSNATIAGEFTLPVAVKEFTVKLKGDDCQGWPVATIQIDDHTVASGAVNAAGWTSYKVTTDITAGTHSLKIQYANDYNQSNCDRNLYADVFSVDTTLPTPSNSWTVRNLYVTPNTQAAQQATAWATSYPSESALMSRVAATPQAAWFSNDTNAQVEANVNSYVTAAKNANAMPVLVAYHIPGRDCGNYSAGGASSKADYQTWITNFARGIGTRPSVVIIEPDALIELTTCLNTTQQQERLDMIKYAVIALKANPTTVVYIDAGNPLSRPVNTISDWLIRAGVSLSDGFSLNVSNFFRTADNINYGNQVSALTGGKHYVIDTSRNGNGTTPDYQWCNPSGRALGTIPDTNPGLGSAVDALLWIKTPGQSDGSCNGSPPSGWWWPEYVVGLGRAAGW